MVFVLVVFFFCMKYNKIKIDTALCQYVSIKNTKWQIFFVRGRMIKSQKKLINSVKNLNFQKQVTHRRSKFQISDGQGYSKFLNRETVEGVDNSIQNNKINSVGVEKRLVIYDHEEYYNIIVSIDYRGFALGVKIADNLAELMRSVCMS